MPAMTSMITIKNSNTIHSQFGNFGNGSLDGNNVATRIGNMLYCIRG